MCFCFYHLSLLSKQLTHYQLNLAFMLADKSFLQAQSDFSPASGLFAKSTVWSKWIRRSTEWLKWTRKTLHEEDFLCLTNVYLFPLPAISFFLNSQDFSRFSSPISPGSMDPGTWPWSWDQDVPGSWGLVPWSCNLGPNQAFPQEQLSCSLKLPCDSEVKKKKRSLVTMFCKCINPTVIAISIYEWVGYYRFYVLFIRLCFCLSLHQKNCI